MHTSLSSPRDSVSSRRQKELGFLRTRSTRTKSPLGAVFTPSTLVPRFEVSQVNTRESLFSFCNIVFLDTHKELGLMEKACHSSYLGGWGRGSKFKLTGNLPQIKM